MDIQLPVIAEFELPIADFVLWGDDAPLAEFEIAAEVAQFDVLIGQKGDKGDPGTASNILVIGTFVCASAVKQGQPVYVLKTNGQIAPANTASYVSAFIIGFANQDCAAGFTVEVSIGTLTLTNWAGIARTAQLLSGQNYFLQADGTIDTTPSSAPNSQALALIGKALSPTSLSVYPQQPILL